MEEIYPMPSFPNLVVNDLEASSSFYQNTLGFQHIFTMPGPGGQPTLVHLRWNKYADLLIAKSENGKALTEPKGIGVSLNFPLLGRFDDNIEAFAEHARAHGANLIGPIERPWNVREVTVRDPDGYQLVFTVPINTNMKFDTMLENVVGEKKP